MLIQVSSVVSTTSSRLMPSMPTLVLDAEERDPVTRSPGTGSRRSPTSKPQHRDERQRERDQRGAQRRRRGSRAGSGPGMNARMQRAHERREDDEREDGDAGQRDHQRVRQEDDADGDDDAGRRRCPGRSSGRGPSGSGGCSSPAFWVTRAMPFTAPSMTCTSNHAGAVGDDAAEAHEQQVVEVVEVPLVERAAVQAAARRWRSASADRCPGAPSRRKKPNRRMPSDDADGGHGDAERGSATPSMPNEAVGVLVHAGGLLGRVRTPAPASWLMGRVAERQAEGDARQRCDGIASRMSGTVMRPGRLVDLAARRAGRRGSRRRTSCPSAGTCRTRSSPRRRCRSSQTHWKPSLNASPRISSLEKKPASGGMPAMAIAPMSIVQWVIGHLPAAGRPSGSCPAPRGRAWITEPEPRNSRPLKKPWVIEVEDRRRPGTDAERREHVAQLATASSTRARA